MPQIDIAELLHLAGHGWRLFPTHGIVEDGGKLRCTCGLDPCGKDNKNAGKHPRIREWEKHATWDQGAIERWHRKWPASNWAVACGATRYGAGLVAIDIDTSANAATIAGLALQHEPFRPTLCVTTGRGQHIYMAGDVGGSHTIGSDKLLVRGEGGYVILPGSLHASGRLYAWVDPAAPLAELPAWLREWVITAGGTQKAPEPISSVVLGERPKYLGLVEDMTERATRGLDAEKSLDEVIQALRRIPSDCSMDTWLNVARALHDWDAGDRGLRTFLAWSARSTNPKHTDGQEAGTKEWNRIKKAKPGKRMIHIASLFVEAAKYPPVKSELAASSTKQFNVTHTPQATFAAGDAIVRPVVWVDTDDDGAPRSTCTNAAIAITGLGVGCSHDVFHDRLLVGGHFIQQWAGDLTDNAVHMLRRNIKRHFRFDPGEKSTRDAATQLCLENPFNPVADYLAGLRWDGRGRIGRWVTDYLGAPDEPLGQEFGRLMLVAAVRRARRPGVKFDQILVWEGREGTGKSTALRILAGDDNFSDQRVLGVSEREQQEAVAGVWLHEIAELAGMRRAEVEQVKAFASKTEDRARPAYGRFRVDRKRQCIFVATTNAEAYLKSDTGDRRFWPLQTGRVALDALARDRDQLWAEAAHTEARGESLVLDWKLWGEAGRVQASRQERDPWYDAVARWIDEKNVHDTSVLEVLENHFHMQTREIGQTEQNRAARTLIQLNFERYQKREGDRRFWRYKRPDSR